MINHISTYLSMWKHGITYYLATTSTFAIGQTTQLCDLKVLGVVGCGGGGGGGWGGGAGEGSRFNFISHFRTKTTAVLDVSFTTLQSIPPIPLGTSLAAL